MLQQLLFNGWCVCVCMTGVVHGTSWELEKVRGNGVMAMLTLAIISVVAALQVFGKDRLIFWRESESGQFTLTGVWIYLCYLKHQKILKFVVFVVFWLKVCQMHVMLCCEGHSAVLYQ